MFKIDPPQAGQSVIDWAAGVATALNNFQIKVAAGSGLRSRSGPDGATIGLERPGYRIGVVGSGGITARSSTTPGKGLVQPYQFNGFKYVPIGNTPITVFNKSKQAVGAGFWVSWNSLDGFPHLDWSDCTAG